MKAPAKGSKNFKQTSLWDFVVEDDKQKNKYESDKDDESDEKDSSPEDQEESEDSESQLSEDEKPQSNEEDKEESVLIELILGRRIRKPNDTTEPAPEQEVYSGNYMQIRILMFIQKRDAEEDPYEYLIKRRGYSYLHLEWLSRNELYEKYSNGRTRLPKYLSELDFSEGFYSPFVPYSCREEKAAIFLTGLSYH